ncbi:GRB2-related adapter protein-like isoform X1 [Limanda limanda]|uniref:GRB2-related adapter protein-like isoform X1 n=1 Tax=Limanda limanda TaxID=27771 RepID=UPI0029C62A6C|nr:GRB2-related adapter protein-like isoform X1 [Limanda limanda]
MEAVALFSFTASAADEIGFQKGDIIKVTEMEDDLSWVTAEIQGKRGYIPENYISLFPHRWFAGRVSRLEAEQRLRWQEAGVFLVRESESAPGEFSVSVSYGDRVEHFRVLEGGGQYCIWDETFGSLNRLVDFYRTHSIAVEKLICLIDRPPSPRQVSNPGYNPYPNPYKSSSQESLPSARLYSQPQREAAPVKPCVAHALCDYTPHQAGHLHFLRGDVIDLLECSGSATWKGRCRGRVGVFPPQYVQLLYH